MFYEQFSLVNIKCKITNQTFIGKPLQGVCLITTIDVHNRYTMMLPFRYLCECILKLDEKCHISAILFYWECNRRGLDCARFSEMALFSNKG